MSANVTSREIVRDALATLLTTALEGTGKPAQKVYNYRAGDFDRQTPVVILTSAGSDRGYLRPQISASQIFYFELHLFTLYAEVDEAGNVTWTDAQSEDSLDALEKAAYDVLLDNSDLRRDPQGKWSQLYVSDRTSIDDELIGDEVYRHEVIPLAVTVEV